MILDSQKTAFVFPGQGSQKVGMGMELGESYQVAKDTFLEADEILGTSLSKICWEGPEDSLNDTINTQPALLVHSVAALRVFQEIHPDFHPDFVAGHSMGEFSALICAGALSFIDALKLVRRRGELMKKAGKLTPGGMGAILGLDIQAVVAICTQASIPGEFVQVANDNCPGQVVISGDKAALERAITLAKESGARKAVSLAVSIAAHSTLMTSAQEEFNQSVEESHIVVPKIPVIGNVSAQPLNLVDEIKSDLQAQLTSRVRWTETIQLLVAQEITHFIEIGSGKVLSGLIKRIERSSVRLQLGNPDDFAKLLANS